MPARLDDHLTHLALRRRHTRADPRTEGLDVPLDRAREVGHAPGDVRPVLLGGRGHQVEHLAHLLRGRRDDVEIPHPQAGVARLDGELEVRAEVGAGDLVDGVDHGGVIEPGEDLLRLGDVLGVPVG